MITLSAIILLFGTPVDLSSSRTNVVVQNLCTGISVKFLTKNEIHKKNEDGMDEYELAPSIGSAYPIVVCLETQCYNYGNMTFLSGRKYIVEVSQCSLPGIRIKSHEVSPVIWQDMIIFGMGMNLNLKAMNTILTYLNPEQNLDLKLHVELFLEVLFHLQGMRANIS